MRFFQRAEELALTTSDYLKPSLLKALVKVRLMISKIFISKKLFKKSLEILWKNVNSLTTECRLRMGKNLGKIKFQDQKMKKWSKYFILNLHQMLFCFAELKEISAVNETARLMDWIASGFFQGKNNFQADVETFTDIVFVESEKYLKMKRNNDYHFSQIIKKIICPTASLENKKKNVRKGLGFIPSSETEESETGVAEMVIYDGTNRFRKKNSYRLTAGTLSRRESMRSSHSMKMNILRASSAKSQHKLSPNGTLIGSARPSHKNKNFSISTQYTNGMTSGIMYGAKSPGKMGQFDLYFRENSPGGVERKKKDSISYRFLKANKKKKKRKISKRMSRKGLRLKKANTMRSRQKKKTLKKNLMDVVIDSKIDKECKIFFFFIIFEKFFKIF